MIICGTGHRPKKLGGYGADVERRLIAYAGTALDSYKPDMVISGMALGWDQALAETALLMGIPYTAAIPFVGQGDDWPKLSKARYIELVDKADRVITVCDVGYASWKMQKRNEWMVDHSDMVLALWNGSEGGTANCVAYAEKVGKPVVNFWDGWLELFIKKYGLAPDMIRRGYV
jgi:uncharacterized phage-like protein YoqJ